MPKISVNLACPVHDSFRVRQVAGIFDLQVNPSCSERFDAQLPELTEPWQIGAIVGPSGSGKTSIAKQAYGSAIYRPTAWPADRAVIDCFGDLPIKQITRVLTAVGFSSPPSWLKPFAVLSTGEKFRCELARAILPVAQPPSAVLNHTPAKDTAEGGCATCVFDEFTSVVDRTVARISSAAISKAIRTGAIPIRFVAVTCHYDVLRWLQPDWVLDMNPGAARLTRRRLRRPPIQLRITRADRSAWKLFQRHHYLSGNLHRSASCFLAAVDNHPAAFASVLPFPHPHRPGWREHRTVCLPDFQGVGIGAALSDFVASLYVATAKPYFSTTSHPAMIAHRIRSPDWRMHRPPALVSRAGSTSRNKTHMADTLSRGRITTGFEYVGAPNWADARRLSVT